jgi:hypothetical protein
MTADVDRSERPVLHDAPARRQQFYLHLADKDCSEEDLKKRFLDELDEESNHELRSIAVVKALFGQLHSKRSRETLVHLVSILADVVVCMPEIGDQLNPNDLQPLPWLCKMSPRLCRDALRICAKISETSKGRDLLVTTNLIKFLLHILLSVPDKSFMESIVDIVCNVSANHHHCNYLVESCDILTTFKRVAASILLKEFKDTAYYNVDRDPKMCRLRDVMWSLQLVKNWNRVEDLRTILYEFQDFCGQAIEQHKELFRLWTIVMANLTHIDSLQDQTIKYGFLENAQMCFMYATAQSVPYLFPALVNISTKDTIKKHIRKRGLFSVIFRRFPADALLKTLKEFDPRYHFPQHHELWLSTGLKLAYNVMQEEDYSGSEITDVLKQARVHEVLHYGLTRFASDQFANFLQEPWISEMYAALQQTS